MNMRIFKFSHRHAELVSASKSLKQIQGDVKHLALLSVFIISLLPSCKKEDPQYEVNQVNIQPPNAGKTKVKTDAQYVSILYANLFQTALSSNKLVEITNCIESVGDKDLVHEVVISNFMNRPEIILPNDSVMRSDIDAFLTETYHRFYVREMTEAERTWFKNYILSHPDITPEHIYFSFALSNEYQFY
jgi:hypothetical protein